MPVATAYTGRPLTLRRLLLAILALSVVLYVLLCWRPRARGQWQQLGALHDGRSVRTEDQFTLPTIYGVYQAFLPTADDKHALFVMREQVDMLFNSSLLQNTHTLTVNLVSDAQWSDPPEPLRRAQDAAGKGSARFDLHVHSKGEEHLSIDTITALCKRDPSAWVYYLHAKGSYHQRPENELYRRNLMGAVVSNWRNCTRAMARLGGDTCGLRVSVFPFVHYPGNMWWARCEYINQLKPLAEIGEPRAFDPPLCAYCLWEFSVSLGRGRLTPEHWIGTHPLMRAVDCLPNSDYEYGYTRLEEAQASTCTLGPRLTGLHLLSHDEVADHWFCHSTQRANCQHIAREYNAYYGALSAETFDVGTVGYYVRLCAGKNFDADKNEFIDQFARSNRTEEECKF